MSAPYPTDEDLTFIMNWQGRDVHELFRFIEELECMKVYGTFRRTILPDGRERIRISTGGWSGNEELIGALERNYLVHGLYWKASARGGLEIYIIPSSASVLTPAKEEVSK